MKTFISLSKKLTASIKSKLPVIKKLSKKNNAALDKKISPAALKKSRDAADEKLKALKLVSAGFGRYHKGKGQPITHWIMRGPKTGKYLLVNRRQRAKLLGKPMESAIKKSTKSAKVAHDGASTVAKKARQHHVIEPSPRLLALRKELGKVALRRKELSGHDGEEVQKQRDILEKRRGIIRKMIRKERHALIRAKSKKL